jgi:hypothetical protein
MNDHAEALRQQVLADDDVVAETMKDLRDGFG